MSSTTLEKSAVELIKTVPCIFVGSARRSPFFEFFVPLYGQCVHMVINDRQWEEKRDPAQFHQDLDEVCGTIANNSFVFVAPFKYKAFLEIMGK